MAVKVEDAQAMIGQIVTILQNYPSLVVNEIIKGGSLGHGTAVPGHFDVDLVLYSESITVDDMLKGRTYGWMQNLHKYLAGKLQAQYKMVGINVHTVTFTVKSGRKEVSFDLLISPWWDSKEQLLNYMSGKPWNTVRMFLPSVSKWQVQFIENVPNRVKELIKRARYWRNRMWPSGQLDNGRPKSYLMAILVISACWDYVRDQSRGSESLETLNSESFTVLARGVAAIMQRDVRNHHNFQISWGKQLQNYPQAQVPKPYILDPANPFNNMYRSGVAHYVPHEHFSEYSEGNDNWDPFVRNVGTLDLTQPIPQ